MKMPRNIILHMFNWNLKDIIPQLDKVKECGYTAIQISPIHPCKEGEEWWKLYQPLGFEIGNRTGTREELIELCSKAKELGIKIIVDVVLRHCAGVNSGELIPHETVVDKLKNNPNVWTNAKNTDNYNDRWCATHMAFGVPMLDYDNEYLQSVYIEFLQELRNCGVSGFRVDMGKHFALEDEGSNFWKNVFGEFRDMFNYAECLECDTQLLDKYTKFINVLTDGTSSDRSKMVIYVMTHDTEETFGFTKKMNDSMIITEWEHLLKTYKESSVLFYIRPYSNLWKSQEIKEINLRY